MEAIDERVHQLTEELFGGLHDFHAGRTAVWLQAALDEFGDGVLETVREKGVDTYGLYRWHLERTLAWIDALTETYGPAAQSVIIERHRADRRRQGEEAARRLGSNSLEDIIPFFSHGNDENIIEQSEKHVLIKATGCLAGKIAFDIGRAETVYALHCALDRDFTEGFHEHLGCEVKQTLMDGHDCCIHRIYVRE